MILKGKRALVTGGAVRIGRTIARALQDEGVEVVVHYRNSREEAEELSPFTVQGDLESVETCAELIEQAGPVDILINNASIFSKDALEDAAPAQVRREFNINLFAPLELIRAFGAQGGSLSSAGQEDAARAVVNLLDRRIKCNDPQCVPYTLTKTGLEKLTRLAALSYAPDIRVNAVAPGPILPPPGSSAKSARESAGNIPLEDLPSPEDIAEAVLYLLRADAVTGQTIFVDGGQHLLGNGV